MTTLSHKKVILDSPYNGDLKNGHECRRCGGFMVPAFWTHLVSASEWEIAPRRCVQCGDVIDAVILRNRSLHQQSVATQHLLSFVH